MVEFIALRCPSCGGSVQTEKDLEKLFCTHCGTQIILGQGEDGVLIPLKARQLAASAALKDAQTARMLTDHFEETLSALAAEAAQLRRTFLQFCVDHIYADNNFSIESKTNQLINHYTRAVTGKPQMTRKLLLKTGWHERKGTNGNYSWFMEQIFALQIPALDTPADLYNLYQFIIQPQVYDQTASALALALRPITRIYPQMQKCQTRIDRLRAALVGQ